MKDRDDICLMEDQAKHVYKKVETENIVNIDTIKQEIEADKLDKVDDNSGEINPYHEIITNNVEKSYRSLVFSGTVHWFEGRQAFIHYCGLHQV